MSDYQYNPNAGAIAGQSGAFTLDIRFTRQSISDFHRVHGALSSIKNDTTVLWNAAANIIATGIFEQLVFGFDPGGKTWPDLRPGYAKRVGRTRMYIPQTSPIFDAYVWNPTIRMGASQMTYQPSGIPELHWLALQTGFKAGKTHVPAREWFGMSQNTLNRLDEMMATFIEARIAAASRSGAQKEATTWKQPKQYLGKKAKMFPGADLSRVHLVQAEEGFDANADYLGAYP
jgi:hypothetical protein